MKNKMRKCGCIKNHGHMKKCGCVKNHDDMERWFGCKDDHDMKKWFDCKDDDDMKRGCCCKDDDDDMKKDCCCSSSSMCNGVFAPVCCNGVCTVSRMPHRVDIVLGAGMFENEAEPEEPEEPGEPVDPEDPEEPEPEKANAQFKIRIFKEFSRYKGELLIADHENGILIHSEKLECFHSDFRTKMVAIFHIPEGPTTGSYELTVYASPAYCTLPAKFHAFSAPLCGEGIFIGGNVSVGDIMICKDKKQH